jgi:hypothetical protein
MAYEQTRLKELVERAVNHQWSIPEFQRGFVWKPTQVRDLAESLWLDYPVGSLLVWNSTRNVEERAALDAKQPPQWLVDGQQRVTALCVLFGRKPYWWKNAEEWNRILKRYDIRFDVDAKEAPYFWVASAPIKKSRGDRYVKMSRLLLLDTNHEEDQTSLTQLAREIKAQGYCDGMDSTEVYTRLDRVRKIRDKEIINVTVDHELEDVVEIFARLNSQGTRVTEADIYLGYVAARNPGWVRDDFLPYHTELAEAGFKINPNLLFRSLTGVGKSKARFKDISDDFWNAEAILPAWEQTKTAWQNLIKVFREFGILSNAIMPTEAALVTFIKLMDKYPTINPKSAIYWLLQASRYGRYSGSSVTSLDEDLRDIQESNSFNEAVNKLLARIGRDDLITSEDFLRDYGDSRFGRFMLYLLVYRNEAVDWDEKSNRIGFEGLNVLSDFQPQWHHIFPKKYLFPDIKSSSIDALANIAVIGPTINIRISAKSPMDYVKKYKISSEKLKQQFIDPEFTNVQKVNFEKWADERAAKLADAANSFLNDLKAEL